MSNYENTTLDLKKSCEMETSKFNTNISGLKLHLKASNRVLKFLYISIFISIFFFIYKYHYKGMLNLFTK